MLRATLGPLAGATMALGGCAMLSGASDLTTDLATTMDSGSNGDASSGPPADANAEAGPGPGGDAGDAGVDAMSSSRIREVTFENGTLTGKDGADTVTGLAAVRNDGPLRGKVSMAAAGPSAFVDTTFAAANEIYASFLFQVAAFPSANASAVIARVGFAGTTATLDFTATSGAALTVVAPSGSSISLGGVLAIGNVYRVGIHLRHADGSMIIEPFVAEGATATFPTKGSRITISSPGAVTHIAMGALGSDSLAAVWDHLLIDSLAMPAP